MDLKGTLTFEEYLSAMYKKDPRGYILASLMGRIPYRAGSINCRSFRRGLKSLFQMHNLKNSAYGERMATYRSAASAST